MTIGLVAVLHVLISHGLAIGAIAIVVLSEFLGYKRRSPEWERFAKDLLKVSIIVITGVGAVTGVGIWFTTSALSPRGIGSLLRVFFWPWFTEWLFFVSEVIVILIYYFSWDRWTGDKKKLHIYLGMSYSLIGLGSATLITGILGFMLTPDGWPWDKSIWSAFFNPSFLPQLLVRFGIMASLGSLFAAAYLLFTRREKSFRREALGILGQISLVAVLSLPLSAWWYFAVVPSRFKTHFIFGILTSHLSQHPQIVYIGAGLALLGILAFSLAAVLKSSLAARSLVIPALLLSVIFVSVFERTREFIRGPYLIPGYLYASNVLIQEGPFLDRRGMLDNSYWYNMLAFHDPINQGAYLFAENCAACHTIDGINDIRKRVKGRSENGIAIYLTHIDEMVPFMPPFSGTEKEKKILARFLYRLANKRIALEAPSRYTPLNGEAGHE
jgi:hypothetical protein